MSADSLAAVVAVLAGNIAIDDLVDSRIYGGSLDRDVIPAMPVKAIVVTAGGRAPSAGDASYVQVGRVRFDVRCYGEDEYEAMSVYVQVHGFMKALRPQTVALDDGGVRLHNAEVSAGPIQMVDPDTDWNVVVATYSVHASEVEVLTGLVSS